MTDLSNTESHLAVKTAAKALYLERYTKLSDAFEHTGGLGLAAAALKSDYASVAKDAHLFNLVSAEDPRVRGFVVLEAIDLGEVPAGTEMEKIASAQNYWGNREAALTKNPAEAWRAVKADVQQVFESAEERLKETKGEPERKLFMALRATKLVFENAVFPSSQTDAAGGALEGIYLKFPNEPLGTRALHAQMALVGLSDGARAAERLAESMKAPPRGQER